MADVKIVDIDGEQWNIKDQEARNSIEEILNKRSEVLDTQFHGTFIFDVKMKYIGEDNNYIYYNFWWEPQEKKSDETLAYIMLYPQDETSERILTLNLNIFQEENASIIQKTQHSIGVLKQGMTTYISNSTSNKNWAISGMGILRKAK